jgi:hypothetical protein
MGPKESIQTPSLFSNLFRKKMDSHIEDSILKITVQVWIHEGLSLLSRECLQVKKKIFVVSQIFLKCRLQLAKYCRERTVTLHSCYDQDGHKLEGSLATMQVYYFF